ncbi:hypothetical protein MRB53_042037 [Persea americana]|nr:hypothetical protein MRB53_042037 [Persea americana]
MNDINDINVTAICAEVEPCRGGFVECGGLELYQQSFTVLTQLCTSKSCSVPFTTIGICAYDIDDSA